MSSRRQLFDGVQFDAVWIQAEAEKGSGDWRTDAEHGTRLTIALASSDSPDRCLFTDTRGMRAVNRCFQHMMTLLGLEWTQRLILTPPPKGIIVGLIQCPWCGILLFIETVQKILSTSTQPRYSDGHLTVTWLNGLPELACNLEVLVWCEICQHHHQQQQPLWHKNRKSL